MSHGCHSDRGHVRATGHWVQDGWVAHTSGGQRVEARRMVWCEDAMTRECQYRIGTPDDEKCEGCEL